MELIALFRCKKMSFAGNEKDLRWGMDSLGRPCKSCTGWQLAFSWSAGATTGVSTSLRWYAVGVVFIFALFLPRLGRSAVFWSVSTRQRTCNVCRHAKEISRGAPFYFVCFHFCSAMPAKIRIMSRHLPSRSVGCLTILHIIITIAFQKHGQPFVALFPHTLEDLPLRCSHQTANESHDQT